MARRQNADDQIDDEELDEDELEDDDEADEDDDESEQDSDDAGDSDDSDDDGDDEDEGGFQGKFDAKRARSTINRLRRENRDLRKNKGTKVSATEMNKLRTENLQLSIAHELGIPIKIAKRLTGKTREEMLEDASDLLDELGLDEDKPKPRQPKPRLRGGSRPNRAAETSAADVVKDALGR